MGIIETFPLRHEQYTAHMVMVTFDDIFADYHFKSAEELLSFVEGTPRPELYEGCHRLTRARMGRFFDTCSIINVKSGLCSEDCHWCAQSAHYATGCEQYGILSPTECVAQAQHNRSLGVKRFSLVASGRRPSHKELARYIAIFEQLGEACDIACCASLGLATEEQLAALHAAGVTTYHCNMESAPSHFSKLCTTHTQREKEETLRAAQRVGMKRCSGGILGMGESRLQRCEFAIYLSEMGIESIPLNFLQPIPGTPLGNQKPLSAIELLETVAIFRLANPSAFLRFSGGRGQYDDATQRMALYIGINAAITGDLLTTVASETERDMKLFTEAGYDPQLPTTWNP